MCSIQPVILLLGRCDDSLGEGFLRVSRSQSRLISEIGLYEQRPGCPMRPPWKCLRNRVPDGLAWQRGPRCDNRRFIEAQLWTARSGGRWRDPPERQGDPQAVRRRYRRIEGGVLDEMLAASSAPYRPSALQEGELEK